MRITIDRANVSVDGGKVIIDLDSAQLENILNADKVQLSTLKPKDEFKIGNEVFIVLEQTESGTRVIAREFAYHNVRFGNNSNWKESLIRTLLNSDYYNKIAKLVGASNIIPMERDLTSLDGLDDYGTCNDKISLLSAFEYAKYHKILGLNSKYSDWWVIITPASTPSNGRSYDICYVDTSGTLNRCVCSNFCEIRPFLNLEPSILVSLNKNNGRFHKQLHSCVCS